MKKLFQSVLVNWLVIVSPCAAQWIPVNVGTFSNLVDVQFINDSVGFISGEGTILRTTDYGKTWANTNNTGNNSTFRVHFPGDSIGYALAGNLLYKTIDQGATWSALPSVNSGDKRNIYFINDTTGFFLTAYGFVFKTTDGGVNWSAVNTNCDWTIDAEDLWFVDQNIGYYCGWYAACAAKTIDGGNTWQPLTGNHLSFLKSIHFPSAATGYIAGSLNNQQKCIQKTNDAGATWQLQTTPGNFYNSIFCVDTNICYAAGRDGEIIRTTNGGASWQPDTSGTHFELRQIYCPGLNTCYAVGDSGTVLKIHQSNRTALRKAEEAGLRIQLYPNPAKEILKLDTPTSDFQVEIFSASGRLISQYQRKSNIDVSSLPEGLYLIMVSASDSFYSSKFIIERR